MDKLNALICCASNNTPAAPSQQQPHSAPVEMKSLSSEESQRLTAPDGSAFKDKENQEQNSSIGKSAADKSSQQRHSQPDFDTHHHHQQQQHQQNQTHTGSPRPLSEANSELSCDLLSESNTKSSIELSLVAAAPGSSSSSNNTTSNNDDAATKRSSSVNSNETTSGGSGGGGSSERKRALPKHQRPLTRYLPIFSPDLNLRHHIESAGHQIALCPHVFVDAYSCRGYLHKLGATFHGWARRWFVLDRQRSAFIYYADKSERKPRGGAYFSTIDEVYLDHLNASKSGRPHCTFIVKTKKRSYHLQAASDAAARIWIDAIITGAQGNLDY